MWQEVKDGGFGALNEDKSWTGMIGEVSRGVSYYDSVPQHGAMPPSREIHYRVDSCLNRTLDVKRTYDM